MDPDIWLKTLPGSTKPQENEKNEIEPNTWVNTISKKKVNRLSKKYFFTAGLFILGLVLVSVVKNVTRDIEKEISILQASINELKINLHEEVLEYGFISSPENIEKLAKEHLVSDFVPYKKSQIKQFNKFEKIVNTEDEKKKNTITFKVAKKIDQKKKELKKLKEIYSQPSELPKEVKLHISKKIKKTKKEIKNIYSSPEQLFTEERVR
ncbi:hypothetical protein OAJ64_01130, partial [Pelagibacteraceae bacterium]|nr:hypothetical protein [Pelagibacteraceae bacterium]